MKNTVKNDKAVYYEVIRLRAGALLFLEEHITRLQKSLALAGRAELVSSAQIRQSIFNYIGEHGIKAANIRLTITPAEQQLIAVNYITGIYPTEAIYQRGVAVATADFERHDPNVKQLNSALFDLRTKLSEQNIHDFLLVDRAGYITEGSKTNVFFVKGRAVYTAPLKNVLGGITRAVALDCIPSNCRFSEKALKRDEALCCDAAFLTGTSIDILPISTIDDVAFKSADNAVVKDMIQYFRQKVNDYIAANQIVVGD